jgi:phosphopantothenoylcysteine decarboxylase/phosphopantothenate--cysteine ligase
MHNEVMKQISDIDIFISAAAVADYSLENIANQKIKKSEDSLELKLKKNPDILAAVSALENAPFSVGFAAETENLETNAQIKLQSKKLDMIAANQVGESQGFDVDTNALTIYWKTGKQHFESAPKSRLARNLISLIANQYNEKNTNKAH